MCTTWFNADIFLTHWVQQLLLTFDEMLQLVSNMCRFETSEKF